MRSPVQKCTAMVPSAGAKTFLRPLPVTVTTGLHRSNNGTLVCMMTVMVLLSQGHGELWPVSE